MCCPPLILFLCRSASLQDSVTCFLSSANPGVMLTAATPAAALEELAQRQPDLVIADTYHWNGEVAALMAEIKTNWPKARCLILAETRLEQASAEAGGADGVLLWGFVPEQLLVTVRSFMDLPASAASRPARQSERLQSF